MSVPEEIPGGPWLRHQADHWNTQKDMKNSEPICVVCGKPGEHDQHISIRCAWCKSFMGFEVGDASTKGMVSHGMCDDCRQEWPSKVEDSV